MNTKIISEIGNATTIIVSLPYEEEQRMYRVCCSTPCGDFTLAIRASSKFLATIKAFERIIGHGCKSFNKIEVESL